MSDLSTLEVETLAHIAAATDEAALENVRLNALGSRLLAKWLPMSAEIAAPRSMF